MEVQIGLIIQPCMASKKQFQIFLLYQNCDCQESLDYPALEKAGHLSSDESNREKGDMLSVQVKSLNSMEKKKSTFILYCCQRACVLTSRYAHNMLQFMVNSL